MTGTATDSNGYWYMLVSLSTNCLILIWSLFMSKSFKKSLN
ncbi:hypothetical protein MACK_003633 [Theileria orientalis]|uniref:Uncharacterized protein n=1 Tax=Theileria orientalis TaxID=68886 RepID=A0A976XJZ7_THEOR|nr:hypothetical protein MACK_003633 [Theileria orientalis]